MDRGAWLASPKGHKELDMTEHVVTIYTYFSYLPLPLQSETLPE